MLDKLSKNDVKRSHNVKTNVEAFLCRLGCLSMRESYLIISEHKLKLVNQTSQIFWAIVRKFFDLQHVVWMFAHDYNFLYKRERLLLSATDSV